MLKLALITTTRILAQIENDIKVNTSNWWYASCNTDMTSYEGPRSLDDNAKI